MEFDETAVLDALREAWSDESSSLWTEETPARGHCGVTALVVQDHHGGEIQKTMLEEGPHFYNVIEGHRYDLTVSQFDTEPEYQDLTSSREEAFASTNGHQYAVLSKRFEDSLTEV